MTNQEYVAELIAKWQEEHFAEDPENNYGFFEPNKITVLRPVTESIETLIRRYLDELPSGLLDPRTGEMINLED